MVVVVVVVLLLLLVTPFESPSDSSFLEVPENFSRILSLFLDPYGRPGGRETGGGGARCTALE